METRDYIEQHLQREEEDKIKYEILDDGNARILTGQYEGMLLSDIFICAPWFIDWIQRDNRFHADLKFVANIIKRDGNLFADAIQREMDFYGR